MKPWNLRSRARIRTRPKLRISSGRRNERELAKKWHARSTMIDAITEALAQEMERDERVFVMGEDIGPFGRRLQSDRRAFTINSAKSACSIRLSPKTTSSRRRLARRWWDSGRLPEIQFADFITPAMETHGAASGEDSLSQRRRIRLLAYGAHLLRRSTGSGLYHSQENAAWFMHEPGLKVVMPSTPYDAKGLLLAAIRDPNPVLYFEHKKLYRTAKGEVPEGDYTVPLGKAAIRREGRDMTVLTYGSYDAAVARSSREDGEERRGSRSDRLAHALAPRQRHDSRVVRKTSKCLIVHEDKRTMGIGAELSAIVAEEAFDDLDGPIVRITGPDIPAIPFARPSKTRGWSTRRKLSRGWRSSRLINRRRFVMRGRRRLFRRRLFVLGQRLYFRGIQTSMVCVRNT